LLAFPVAVVAEGADFSCFFPFPPFFVFAFTFVLAFAFPFSAFYVDAPLV
jgi:hypothetical protein